MHVGARRLMHIRNKTPLRNFVKFLRRKQEQAEGGPVPEILNSGKQGFLCHASIFLKNF
jgi:hypothetical protein